MKVSSRSAEDRHNGHGGGVPRGAYRPSFLIGGCPRCIGGTLSRVFTGEDYSCFNCGYVDSSWARFYLTNPVIPTITKEEIGRLEPKYVVPESIDVHKLDILRDLPVLGLKPTLRKYGMSMGTWWNVKRVWRGSGTVFPDGRSRANRKRAGFADSISQVSSDGATISVASLFNMIGVKEKEIERTLESSTWPNDVDTFLKAQLEAYRVVKSGVEELARGE